MSARRFVAITLTSILCVALAPPAVAVATIERPGVLHGTVYPFEGTTGERLPGVRVEVRRWVWPADPDVDPYFEAPLSTVTDDQGSYEFTGLSGNDYYSIAFIDTTGTRRDMSYVQRGRSIGDSDAWRPDSFPDSWGADAALPLLSDLKAKRTYRVAGAGRYDTALKISHDNFPAADTVILASGGGFADALAASPLAGVKDAPLLLTPTAGVPSGLITEIRRLFAASETGKQQSVIIVGGTASVSNKVRDQLVQAGIAVTRIAGANRYDTAAKIAKKVQAENGNGDFAGNDEPFICRGDVFADALAVSPFAYAEKRPILLTATSGPSSEVRTAWSSMKAAADGRVIFIGGPNSITEPVYMFFDGTSEGDNNIWLYGGDRYATGEAVVNFYGGDADKGTNPNAWPGWWRMEGGFDYLAIASGANYPDALAGGVAAGANRAALLLTPPTSLGAPAKRQIQQHGKWVIDMQVYGGTSAVAASVMTAAKASLGSAVYDVDDGSLTLPAAIRPFSVVGPSEWDDGSLISITGVTSSRDAVVRESVAPAVKLRDCGYPVVYSR